jgi:hypothetical protein
LAGAFVCTGGGRGEAGMESWRLALTEMLGDRLPSLTALAGSPGGTGRRLFWPRNRPSLRYLSEAMVRLAAQLSPVENR